MANTIELKDLRKIISAIGKKEPPYEDVSKALLENLNTWGRPWLDKHTQQNILNSFMERDILDMMIDLLPEKFDYDRHSFAKRVIEVLKQKWVELY